MKKFLVLFSLLIGFCGAQVYKTLITSTYSFDATSYNNSHKIAVKNLTKLMNDTIHVVYHSSDSLFYVLSTDEGLQWQTPLYLGKGRHPAIDLDKFGRPHIVWEYFDTTSGGIDIYYDCLNDTVSPLRINLSDRDATLPDVVIDSNLVAHFVWQEDINGKRHIYYRNYSMGSLSDTMRLSNYNAPLENNTGPGISIFRPNNRIYVLWSSVDSSSYTPFRICYRYNEAGNWSGINSIYEHFRPLHNISLDYSHGSDSLSACWEDSSSGNLEARFYGGNPGGGYPTPGLSRYPVVSTVGSTWSYLFWDEDSSGFKDIYYHLYYCMTGWYARNSIRNFFSINESVRFPNACGAYVIWTQGDTPPYKIYFANFGYPIGVEENQLKNSLVFSVYPNPFQNATNIKFQIPNPKSQTNSNSQIPNYKLQIYDATGRLVKDFSRLTFNVERLTVLWDGSDDSGHKLPAGVYFVRVESEGLKQVEKVVLLR